MRTNSKSYQIGNENDFSVDRNFSGFYTSDYSSQVKNIRKF